MAAFIVLFLLPAVLAFVLLRRHCASVYYHFHKAVSNIFGLGPASPPETDTSAPTRYFRISDIPSIWNEDHLVQTIKSKDPRFDVEKAKISLYPSCNGTGQTALLCLSELSEYFHNLRPEETRYLTISSEGSTVTVSIDSHFYDLTPLNTPGGPIIAE
jgi:hypothetical protein